MASARLIGAVIRSERLRLSWSQQGLCRGLCSVSYLSKIEQGKAEAGRELIAELMARLSLPRETGDGELAALTDAGYEAAFDLDARAGDRALAALEGARERLERGLWAADYAILRAALGSGGAPEPGVPSEALEPRARELLLGLRGEYGRLLREFPSSLSYFLAGNAACGEGRWAEALELLQRAYRLASEEGRAFIMLNARAVMGNCYSNMYDYDRMAEHYAAARRLARAVGDADLLRDLDYNAASSALELGRAREAYDYFSSLAEPSAMELHKLAVSCELLGRRGEALAALDRADDSPEVGYIDGELVRDMLRLVRMRLENADYLRSREYGALLLDCFSRIRNGLPSGYAGFHLRWVAEWHTASRQYKEAYELLRDFPGHPPIR